MRQKFDRIGCRISAARSTGLVALSGRDATPIQTSNFCRVESNAYIMLMYWACVDWDWDWDWLSKMASWRASCERQTSEESWRQCSIYCCIDSLFLRLPSIIFRKMKSLRWISWSAILDSYVAFVTFFRWPTYTDVSIQWIKFGRNSTYESAVAFLPHLIELNSTRQKCDVWTGPKM